MIDFAYLYRGLCGVARAHRAGTMAGHLGAALVAGYFFGEDDDRAQEAVHRGMERELDRVVAGEEAIWFNAMQVGLTPADLFEPFEESKGDGERIPWIAEALEANVGELRQSGHNVIFGSLAIRAFTNHPEYATKEMIDGTCRLMRGFQSTYGGRGYWGKEMGWFTSNEREPSPESDFPAYQTIGEMIDRTVDTLIETAQFHRQGFGGLWHLVNHAAAIVELDASGFRLLAHKALPAHHRHLRYWNSLPDLTEELGAVERSEFDPLESEYWAGELRRDKALLTHRIKTLYGFRILERTIDDETRRQQAREALRYLMA